MCYLQDLINDKYRRENRVIYNNVGEAGVCATDWLSLWAGMWWKSWEHQHQPDISEQSIKTPWEWNPFAAFLLSLYCWLCYYCGCVITRSTTRILLLFRCMVKDTHTCPHLPPLRRQRRAAHDDVFADRTVVIVTTAPPEFHWCLSHVLHQQTSRRSWGSCSNQRQV